MTGVERRSFGLEVRAVGRRLRGTILRYGERSTAFNERFSPGSLRLDETVPVNLHHDRERAVGWHPGGGIEIRQDDRGIYLEASDLPRIAAADRALREIRRGQTTGLSIEFESYRERRENGVRVIEDGLLRGVGIVESPAYHGSRVEVRARSGRRLRARIPYDRQLACECIAQRGPGSGGACIPEVKFAKVAGDAMREIMEDGTRDVLAVFKDYSRPLASARKGTVRVSSDDDGLDIEIDLPTGEAGDMAVAASESAGVIVRPMIAYDRMTEGEDYEDTPQGRIVKKPFLRAFLVGSTDDRDGWDDAEIDYDGKEARSEPVRPIRRRPVAW